MIYPGTITCFDTASMLVCIQQTTFWPQLWKNSHCFCKHSFYRFANLINLQSTHISFHNWQLS